MGNDLETSEQFRHRPENGKDRDRLSCFLLYVQTNSGRTKKFSNATLLPRFFLPLAVALLSKRGSGWSGVEWMDGYPLDCYDYLSTCGAKRPSFSWLPYSIDGCPYDYTNYVMQLLSYRSQKYSNDKERDREWSG